MTKRWHVGKADSRISQEIFFLEQVAKQCFRGFRTIPGQPSITDTPLKWLMRAYVKTKFGDEVEEVERLLPGQ